jgi:hypothetical protein
LVVHLVQCRLLGAVVSEELHSEGMEQEKIKEWCMNNLRIRQMSNVLNDRRSQSAAV